MNSNMVKLSNNELDNISGGAFLPTFEDIKDSWNPVFGKAGLLHEKFFPKFWETAGLATWGGALMLLSKSLGILGKKINKKSK